MDSLIVIAYFLIGFISVVSIYVHDMRGVEIDLKYFDGTTVFASFLICMCGVFAPIPILIAFYSSNTHKRKYRITKLIYKLSNIGIKKDIE